ncbi:MFS transporter [Haloarcula sp. 1CSR25-25]|uniref:MFS transporter n=1 Tax=Haloarcula sp. 1CSR25-25 TaxID=2862545 RepID=UPI002895081E|nr:MFS transporter [Haloarcula sp. 1CSR25-25]MDT3435598.1 MFS transporter [Haloarcula sp. 1CSR25-25]
MSQTSDTPATVPWRSRTVQVVLLSTALAPLGVPLIGPTLPIFRDAFGLSDAEASLLVAGYFVVGIVLSPFIGVLTDRVGRKRMLVTGLLTFGLLGGGIAFAPSFEVVMALRVLQGTGAAAIFITTVTIVGDTFEGPQRNTVLGFNIAVLSASAALFPVVGGVLVGFGWNAPFLAYFAAVPVAAFAVVALDEPPREPSGGGVTYLREAVGGIATPGTLGLFGATFLTEFLAFGVVFTAIPFILAATLSPVLIGGVILATEATSTVVAAASGRLARSLSNDRLIALGFTCYGTGFLATWFVPDSLAVAGTLMLVGAGIGLLLPTVDAAVSNRIVAEYRAGAFSLRNSTTFSGRAAGPVTFAGLAASGIVGYGELLLAAAAVAFGAALLALVSKY